jgi:hypothetical protein
MSFTVFLCILAVAGFAWTLLLRKYREQKQNNRRQMYKK